MDENHWIEKELRGVELKDRRLSKRLLKTAKRLADRPNMSIPQACENMAEVKGAYRFFNNEKVNTERIMEGHRIQTIERIKEHSVILAVQDTSTISYSTNEIDGIGLYASSDKSKGLLVHSTLAVTPAGIPLGLLSQKIWTRDPETKGKKHKRKELPIEEKESNRWLEALESDINKTLMVNIGDREADIYELFKKGVKEEKNLLIRASWNRRIEGEQRYLFSQLEKSPISGMISVEVPRDTCSKLPSREAKLFIKYDSVKIRPPANRAKTEALNEIKLSAILASEANPPEGVTPIHWTLLTSMPVETIEDAITKINWYKQRWKIERFHLTLKSGCRVEELQLEHVDRLQRAISVYSIIAWRLLWLTYESRENPESSCEKLLNKQEWESLYCMVNKIATPPKKPPKLNEAIFLIARLGGFLGRKRDGEPGVIVLWRGLQRLKDISEIWMITHPV